MKRLNHRLIFIRHGETDWNAAGRLQGRKDIPINARGRDQAQAVGRAVRKLLGDDAPRVFGEIDFQASPLLRTRQTMELARVAMGLPAQPYRLDERLQELSFGAWEGLTWRDVRSRAPEAARGREEDKWGFVPPEGESYALLCERLLPWLDTVEGDSIVVSHGGVARALLHVLADMPPHEAAMTEIWQGRALVFTEGGFRWV